MKIYNKQTEETSRIVIEVDTPEVKFSLDISDFEGDIKSNLGEYLRNDPPRNEVEKMTVSMYEGIEAMILACAMQGINVTSPEFIRAVHTAASHV